MALKNCMLSRRFLGVHRIANCRKTSPESAALKHRKPPSKISPDTGEDNGVVRGHIHRQSSSVTPGARIIPIGAKVLEEFQLMEVTRNRIRLDGLIPPVAPEGKLTVNDAKKILRLSILENIKARLRRTEKDVVSYSEFFQICAEECSDSDQALGLAKMLDHSGNVIVLGNTVFLRPEQVMKAMKSLLPSPMDKELEQLQKQKETIDAAAGKLVRRELWLGLGYLVIQTAAFMHLTFWELTWDVMEPICFYVTSVYFMCGYAFFLRTSKEPSFEGFYQSRLAAKQKRLIKDAKFDLSRYNEMMRFKSSLK